MRAEMLEAFRREFLDCLAHDPEEVVALVEWAATQRSGKTARQKSMTIRRLSEVGLEWPEICEILNLTEDDPRSRFRSHVHKADLPILVG